MRKLIFTTLFSILFFLGTAQDTYKLAKDIQWAEPEGFPLKMDIYTPNDAPKKELPVLVIFHGGGWLINNKSIMNQMSDYVAKTGKYVVCNVDYRLLGDQENTVRMDEIIQDVFGAVLWVKENIKKYGGDPNNIAVTGDSAGGHLASMVIIMGTTLSESGIMGESKGFTPSYLPKGKSIAKIMKEGGIQVQAGLISYGAFDLYGACQGGFESPGNFFWQMGGAQARPIFGKEYTVAENEDLYKFISPIYNIPNAAERPLPPQLFTVGTEDTTTPPVAVKAYFDKLSEAGHTNIEYWEHQDRPHAFLDSGSNEFLGIKFEEDAPEALDKMLGFLDDVFYK